MKGLKDSLQYKSKEQNEGIKARDKFIKDMDLTIPIPINPTLGMGSSEVSERSFPAINNYTMGSTLTLTEYESKSTDKWLINSSELLGGSPFYISFYFLWTGSPPVSGFADFLFGIASEPTSTEISKQSSTPEADGFNWGMVNADVIYRYIDSAGFNIGTTPWYGVRLNITIQNDGYHYFYYGGGDPGYCSYRSSTIMIMTGNYRLRVQAKNCAARLTILTSPVYRIPMPALDWTYSNGSTINTLCSAVDNRPLIHTRICFYFSTLSNNGSNPEVYFGLSTSPLVNGSITTPFVSNGFYCVVSTGNVYKDTTLLGSVGVIGYTSSFCIDVDYTSTNVYIKLYKGEGGGLPPTRSADSGLKSDMYVQTQSLYFFSQVREKNCVITTQNY